MKHVLCIIGIHSWKTIKAIKLSNIFFLLTIKNPILKHVKFLEKDYIVKDRICSLCKKKDFEIADTKKFLEDKYKKSIK
jgi:hypothetical protein